MDIIAANIW